MNLLDFTPRPPFVTEDVPESDEPLYLAPIGDIQYGSPTFADRSFKEHLEWTQGFGPNVYYIGMGDYIDFASPSNRQRIQEARLYDTSTQTLDDAALRHTENVAELLSDTKGRWIAMLSGHHYWRFANGINSDAMLADMLGAIHIPICGDIDIKFPRSSGRSARGRVRVWIHHGAGNGRNSLTRLARIYPHFPDKDIFLMGHYHECVHKYTPRIIRSGKRNLSRPALLACTGGWLRAYVPNLESYVEGRMLEPRAIGGLVIKITPRQVHGLWAPIIEVISRGT